MSKIAAFAALIVLGIIEFLLIGGLISIYWHWFIMPIFPDLMPITGGQGLGLAVFLGLILPSKDKNIDFSECKTMGDILLKVTSYIVTYYGFALAFGWILHRLLTA